MASAERYSAKQYGPRYGRRLREKVGKIAREKRLDSCPFCKFSSLKRLAAGIWYCKKCENKFAGRAYSVGKKADVIQKETAEA